MKFQIIICCLGSSSLLFSQTGGNNTYEFLNLAIPARVASLGGALISLKDNDLNLSFQNPALLDSTVHNNLALSYIDYFSDISYGYASYSRTFRKLGSFSAGIQYLDYGTFLSASVTGETGSSFSASEQSFNISYSKPIDSLFSIGGTLKSIYSRLEGYNSYGNALDIGAVYNNRKHLFSSAVVIKNIGWQWKTYNETHENLPFEIQFGISKKVKHAPFRLNLTTTHLEKWDLTFTDPSIQTTDPITGEVIQKGKLNRFGDKLGRHIVFGGEILLTKNFHIRMGYNYQRRQEMKLDARPGISGFSFGFGLKILKFHLSYGYARYHMAGGPNHFTMAINFSEFYSRKQ